MDDRDKEKLVLLDSWLGEYADSNPVKSIIFVLMASIVDPKIAQFAYTLLSPMLKAFGEISNMLNAVNAWYKSKLN